MMHSLPDRVFSTHGHKLLTWDTSPTDSCESQDWCLDDSLLGFSAGHLDPSDSKWLVFTYSASGHTFDTFCSWWLSLDFSGGNQQVNTLFWAGHWPTGQVSFSLPHFSYTPSYQPEALIPGLRKWVTKSSAPHQASGS